MRSSNSQRTCSVVQKAQAEKEKAVKAALAAETEAYKANLAALFASEGGEAKAEDKAEAEGTAEKNQRQKNSLGCGNSWSFGHISWTKERKNNFRSRYESTCRLQRRRGF